MKKLSREYGWAAVGVYLLLSALDFPFCFLAVRYIGTDVIGHWEHVILGYIKAAVKWPLPRSGQDEVESSSQAVEAGARRHLDLPGGEAPARILEENGAAYGIEDHGYREAEQANQGENASTSIRAEKRLPLYFCPH